MHGTAAAGRWTATISMRRPASARTTSTSSQTYDDYPVIAMMQFEDLGFCGKGEGPDFVRAPQHSTSTAAFPINTCGGQLSVGQAGAAGGFLGMVEAIRQLTGQARRTAR